MSSELNTNYLKTIKWERDIPNTLYPAPDLIDCSICLIWFEFFLIRSRYQTKKKIGYSDPLLLVHASL